MLRPIAEIGNSLKVGLTSTIDKLCAGAGQRTQRHPQSGGESCARL